MEDLVENLEDRFSRIAAQIEDREWLVFQAPF